VRATPPPRAVAEFFGFPVETLQQAPEPPPPPPPATAAEPPKPRPRETPRYLPIPEKCVAGFDGSSTLHDFRGWTRAVTGEVRFEPDRIEATAKASIVVDARTLDTGNPDRDKDMHELLQSEKFPEFRFSLESFRPDAGGAFTMKGSLEIRGQSRPVEIPGTFTLRADGLLHAKGEFRAKMSDFGIQPPSAMLVIRTSDDIKIWFELWARRSGGAP
jgi:polyisoprenoid-binding protein YceI